MQKRKKYVLLLAGAVLLLFGILSKLIFYDRQQYWENYEIQAPAITDATYLNVYDLRMLKLFGDEAMENELETLSHEMILRSYESNGEAYEEYASNISPTYFKRLNPNHGNEEFDRSHYDFYFDINELTCLCNQDKAIVFYRYDFAVLDLEGNIQYLTSNKGINPIDRLYFEKIDGEWNLTGFYEAA